MNLAELCRIISCACVASALFAYEDVKIKAIVLLDLTTENPKSKYFFNSNDVQWTNLREHILTDDSIEEGEFYKVKKGVSIMKKDIEAIINSDKFETSNRMLASSNDILLIAVHHRYDKCIKYDIKETVRDSLVKQEFEILKGLNREKGNDIVYTYTAYILSKQKANLSIAAEVKGESDQVSSKSEMQLITGQAEHLYLGATINQKDVQFRNNSITPSEKPKSLKIGLYYQPFGDVLSEYDNWKGGWSSNFRNLTSLVVLQASCEFSSKPLTSGACGIGLKIPSIRGKLKFLSGLSLTRGVMWTEGERVISTGKENFHQRDWVWMIGYDLVQVKNWFGK